MLPPGKGAASNFVQHRIAQCSNVKIKLWYSTVATTVSSSEIMSQPWKKRAVELNYTMPNYLQWQMQIVVRLKVATQTRAGLCRLTDRVPSEAMLADINTALCTIPNTSITETSELINTTLTVIPEALEYKIKDSGRGSPLWKRRPEAKISKTRKDVSQLSEMQKSITRDRDPGWKTNTLRCL